MQIYTHMHTDSYIHTYWCWIPSTRVQSTLRCTHKTRGRMRITNSLSDVFHTFLVQMYMKSHNLASCGKKHTSESKFVGKLRLVVGFHVHMYIYDGFICDVYMCTWRLRIHNIHVHLHVCSWIHLHVEVFGGSAKSNARNNCATYIHIMYMPYMCTDLRM